MSETTGSQTRESGANSYGVDVGYFTRELQSLIKSLPNRKPDELSRYLFRLADVAAQKWKGQPPSISGLEKRRIEERLLILIKKYLPNMRHSQSCINYDGPCECGLVEMRYALADATLAALPPPDGVKA